VAGQMRDAGERLLRLVGRRVWATSEWRWAVVQFNDDFEALLNRVQGGVEVAGRFGLAHMESGSHLVTWSLGMASRRGMRKMTSVIWPLRRASA